MSPEEARESRAAREKAIADWQAKDLAQRPARLERIGLSETSDLASARFAGIVGDYYSAWAASGSGADEFTGQLEGITDLVLREVGSLWEERGDWFDRVCRWTFEYSLAPIITEWKSRARKLEIERLEHPTAHQPITIPPAQDKLEPETLASEERKRVVLPILEKNGWTRNTLVERAGVGKGCVYEYLDGKRTLTDPNRKAIAEELGLRPEDLPN